MEMKKILFIIAAFLASCEYPTYKFTVRIEYQNDGKVDTVVYFGTHCRLTDNGCIFGGTTSYYPVCGVRRFEIISQENGK